jgi:hypothetical protein
MIESGVVWVVFTLAGKLHAFGSLRISGLINNARVAGWSLFMTDLPLLKLATPDTGCAPLSMLAMITPSPGLFFYGGIFVHLAAMYYGYV